MYKLTFLQVFNAMRIFLDLSYERIKHYDIADMYSNFGLWYPNAKFEGHPSTRDPAYWEDWIDGMEKTMKKVKITDDYEKLIYDEELAFLCMQTCLEHFVRTFAFEGIVLLLDQVKKAKHDQPDVLWREWIQSINHVLRGTHELDVTYDPFTYEKRY